VLSRRTENEPGDNAGANAFKWQETRRRPLALITAAALLISFGAAARSARLAPRPSIHVHSPAADRLLFLISGEDDGYLEPCGCSSPQIGGLPRRATVITGHPNAVTLDNGDWVDDVGREAELKAGATAEFLGRMKYAACNLGEHDYALGYPLLSLYQQRYHLPLLATNIITPDGKSAFEPVIRIERSGRRIAIYGAMSPSFADPITSVNPLLTVEDPAVALQKAHVGSTADLSILLYHGPSGEAAALVRRFPWVSLVVTAHDGDDPQSIPASPGLPPMLSVGTRARFLGRTEDGGQATKDEVGRMKDESRAPIILRPAHRTYPPTPSRSGKGSATYPPAPSRSGKGSPTYPPTPSRSGKGSATYPPTPSRGGKGSRSSRLLLLPPLSLGPEFRDSPVARRILTEYQDQVVAENLLAQVPRAPLEGNWFAGSAACASCHISAYQVWAKSGHSHAYAALIRAGHSRDPDCVGCHVVGLNSDGGFTSFDQTPQFAEVGCETCHGPQGLHSIGKGPPPAHLSREMCVTCHNPDQSPHFNLNTYWPKVAH